MKVDLEALKERAEDASARAREAQRLADENRDKARRCPPPYRGSRPPMWL